MSAADKVPAKPGASHTHTEGVLQLPYIHTTHTHTHTHTPHIHKPQPHTRQTHTHTTHTQTTAPHTTDTHTQHSCSKFSFSFLKHTKYQDKARAFPWVLSCEQREKSKFFRHSFRVWVKRDGWFSALHLSITNSPLPTVFLYLLVIISVLYLWLWGRVVSHLLH